MLESRIKRNVFIVKMTDKKHKERYEGQQTSTTRFKKSHCRTESDISTPKATKLQAEV